MYLRLVIKGLSAALLELIMLPRLFRRRLLLETLESRVCLTAQLSFDAGRVYGSNATETGSVSVGRLDVDNNVDVVVASTNAVDAARRNIQVLRGNGAGSFTRSALVPTNDKVSQTRVGDYNNDGLRDVFALMNVNAGFANEVQLLRGNGAGGLAAPVKAPNGMLVLEGTKSFDVQDFNRDGKLDVVMVGFNGSVVRFGNGDGTFRDALTDASLDFANSVTAADYTGDGIADILIGRSTNDATFRGILTLLVTNADGSFQPPLDILTRSFVFDIKVGDFDRNGKLDVATLELRAGANPTYWLETYNGTGGRQVTLNQSIQLPFTPARLSTGLAIADFDLDFRVDIAIARSSGSGTGSFVVLSGNGDGTFKPFQSTNVDVSGGDSLAIADFNNDGKVDVAATRTISKNVVTYLNTAVFQNIIRGAVWNDINENQRRDNEPGLAARVVYVDANDNAVFDAGELSTTTGSDGAYELLVPDGSYTIRQELAPGWIQTSPFTPQGFPRSGNNVTVANRQTASNYNFGTALRGTAQGRVFNDYNADGIFGIFESVAAGATVYADLNNNGIRSTDEPMTTVRSDANWGLSLAAGTYVIRVSGGGTINTTAAARTITIPNAGEVLNIDFGVTNPATISGKIYYDLAANGRDDENEDTAQGNQLVFLDLNENSILDPTEPSTRSIVSFDPLVNGRYAFTGLYPKERYVVRLVKPVGYEQTAPIAAGSGTNGPAITFAYGGFDTFYTDFGIFRPVRVSGTVFRDSNANGVVNTTEQGLASVTVFIDYNANGLVDSNEPSTYSSSTGTYLLASSRQGTFNVRAISRSGFTATVPSSASRAVSFVFGAATTTDRNFGFAEGAFSTAPYLAPIDIAVGSNPTALASGDFNRDGKPDFIAVSNAGTTQVFLGQGNGLFTAGQQFSAGDSTRYLIAQDISGDGIIDLIAANDSLAEFGGTVLRGVGDGTFLPPQTLTTIANSYGVAIANFDGKGLPDIAFVGASEGTVGVILVSNQATTFSDIILTNNPAGGGRSLAAGDLNNDGKADLVVANPISNSISVFLGRGNGRFDRKNSVTNGISLPNFVTLADFNGDGKLDIVAANEFSDEVRVVLGNGDGTFGTGRTYAVGSTPTQIAVLDIDRDGKLDLIVSCRSDGTTDISGGVSILRGRGDGTFVSQQVRTAHTSPTAVSVADYDGDGKLDIVAANFFSDDVSFLKNGTPGAVGAINGFVFRDADIDGVRDAGEVGLAGRRVFIDVDNDGIYDPGERAVRTLSAGAYSLTDLPAGTYSIRADQDPLAQLTSPPGQTSVVARVTAGTTVNGRNFGMVPTQAGGGFVFDDRGAKYTGTWTRTSPGGTYGADQINDGNRGKGTKSIEFKIELPAAGYYAVSTRWNAQSNQAGNVPIVIHSATNTRTVTVDQRINGATWVGLGTYYFDPTGGTVTIRTTGTTGFVVADAVQLIPAAAPPKVVKDNADATGITVTGAWTLANSSPGFNGVNYLHDGNPAVKGNSSVSFVPTIAASGTYELFARWTQSAQNTTKARYDVATVNGTVTVIANQRVGGGSWVSLGYFDLNPATARVTIRNNVANGFVIADAIQLVRVQ